MNLSTDMAVSYAKDFLSKMSAPQRIEHQVGKILLSVDDIQGNGVSYAPDKPSVGKGSAGSSSAADEVRCRCGSPPAFGGHLQRPDSAGPTRRLRAAWQASIQRAAKRAKGGNRAPQRAGGDDTETPAGSASRAVAGAAAPSWT